MQLNSICQYAYSFGRPGPRYIISPTWHSHPRQASSMDISCWVFTYTFIREPANYQHLYDGRAPVRVQLHYACMYISNKVKHICFPEQHLHSCKWSSNCLKWGKKWADRTKRKKTGRFHPPEKWLIAVSAGAHTILSDYLKMRGCLICQCIFLSIVLSFCTFSPPIQRPPPPHQAVIPLSFSLSKCKDVPKGSVDRGQSQRADLHIQWVINLLLAAPLWLSPDPYFSRMEGVFGRQGHANSSPPILFRMTPGLHTIHMFRSSTNTSHHPWDHHTSTPSRAKRSFPGV